MLSYLQSHGASFFAAIHEGTGGGFPQSTVDALWSLVWKGLVTNDTFRALRAFARGTAGGKQRGPCAGPRSGRWPPGCPPAPASVRAGRRRRRPRGAGRWWPSAARERSAASRHRAGGGAGPAAAGPLRPGHPRGGRGRGASRAASARSTRCCARWRRPARSGAATSWAGVAAMQFALPPVLDMLRGLRARPEAPEVVTLLAVDPANPYGALLPWPGAGGAGDGGGTARRRGARGPTRTVGSYVILVDGALGAWVGRGGRQVYTLPARRRPGARAGGRGGGRRPGPAGGRRRWPDQRGQLLLAEIDDQPAGAAPAGRRPDRGRASCAPTMACSTGHPGRIAI